MLTIDGLKELGCDTETGLGRCMGNEAFYLRMCGMALDNPGFASLRAALGAGDLAEAFEHAHALKGMLGNVSLTPLYEPVSELTEALREKKDMVYGPLLAKAENVLAALKAQKDS